MVRVNDLQYYLPGLNTTETGKRPKYKLEYLTYEPCALHPPTSAGVDGVEFVYPVPLKELPGALRNGSVAKSGYAPYGLEDLTIGSWTRLAKRLGKAKHAKLRRRFRRYMYMGAEAE